MNAHDLVRNQIPQQIDIMGREVDDHSRVADASGVRAQAPGMGLIDPTRHPLFESAVQLGNGGVETLDVPHGQGEVLLLGRGHELLGLLHRLRNRLLEQDVGAGIDECHSAVEVVNGRERERDDVGLRLVDQLAIVREDLGRVCLPDFFGDALVLVGYRDEIHPIELPVYAGVVSPHAS